MKQMLKLYEDGISYPDRKLEKRKRIQIINKQLKELRDGLCITAPNFDDLLLAQYAYIVTSLNIRNRIWSYDEDSMSFQRRIGELWESFCKATFHESKQTRAVEFPDFNDVKNELSEKRIPKDFWSLLGNVNLKVDSLFVSQKRLTAVDLKYGFNSHEKGNMQRLKTVGQVYKKWKPKIRLHILVREPDNTHYLEELSSCWDVKQGDAAYQTIKDLTGYDLRTWIDSNIAFKKHLDKDLYSNIQEKNLEKYLQW